LTSDQQSNNPGPVEATDAAAIDQQAYERRAAIHTILAKPLLLEGEDPAAYAGLQEVVRADVQPADFIEKVWTHDVVYNQWEILRYRRFKTEYVKLAKQHGLDVVLQELTKPMRGMSCFLAERTQRVDVMPFGRTKPRGDAAPPSRDERYWQNGS
jgi:hypothetical protein